ncbi:MAG: PDZ domain-containing protein [Firmicutes bacterium]|nr:PDZ domain-containing protein [Bacillota bacterium]MBQ2454741.1 PDZ domain-containing protein [Bacillota bacterium]
MNRNQTQMRRIARVLALVLAFALIASSAFYLIMAIAGPMYAFEGGPFVYGADEAAEDPLRMSEEDQYRMELLEELLPFIKKNFRDEVEYDTMIRGMYKGLMESLDDRWTEYYFAGDSAADEISVSLDSEFYGVGVSFTQDENGFRIQGITEGSPAQEAGVIDGGYIVSVDGKSTEGLDMTQVVLLIRGEEGTKVTLGVSYAGKLTEYVMERRKITTASLTYKMLDNGIGYINIDSFSETTSQEFSEARLALLNQGMNGMIIDLRSNGGGYISEAWNIADRLTGKGVLGYYFQQGEVYETIKTYDNKIRKVPIVVLVNQFTASASEALTAALKENGAAVVVGEVTYGKGEAQIQYTVKNGDSFKITFITFTGPTKKPINGVGIVPDFLVYTYGGYTSEEAAKIVNSMVPLNENERCYEGDMSLNVLAAQQRLNYLGYDVERTGIMDAPTMDALREVQKRAGSYAYGNLDNFTIKALKEQFNALLGIDRNGDIADTQLQKAIDVLIENMDVRASDPAPAENSEEQKAAD